ncbi:DUF6056 family protein [Helicobacter sp. T3_23-1059]
MLNARKSTKRKPTEREREREYSALNLSSSQKANCHTESLAEVSQKSKNANINISCSRAQYDKGNSVIAHNDKNPYWTKNCANSRNDALDFSQAKIFLMFYVFFFVLNALFPAQSDDLGAGIGTIESIKNSYSHWNGRLGELAKVAFGSYLAHTPYFAFINAFFDVGFLYLLFVLVFGRLPRKQNMAKGANVTSRATSSEQTSKTIDSSDIAILCFVLIAFMVYRAFGAVFLWAAGSFNYLWAYCLILGFCVPYRMLASKIYNITCNESNMFHNKNISHTESTAQSISKHSFFRKSKSENSDISDFSTHQYDKNTKTKNNLKESIKSIAMLALGVLAGWGSEFGIVLILCLLAFVAYTVYRGIKLPLWAYFGIVGFVGGFCVLYFSPGHRARAEQHAELMGYVSISKLWAMSLSEKYARFSHTFRGDTTKTLFMQIATLGIIAFMVFRGHITRFFGFGLVVFFVFVSVKWGSVGYFAYLFAPSAAMLCIYSYTREKSLKSNNYALFLVLAGLFIVHFLATGATIQVGIPPRAKLIFVLLGIAMILVLSRICAPYTTQNLQDKLKNVIFVVCFVLALFVLYASVDMRLKWERMLASIDAQKALGRQEIVVNKEVFSSFYHSYTNWGNPSQNPNEWPNTSYARYFKVEKFIAK